MTTYRLDFSPEKTAWLKLPNEGLSDEQREFLFAWINKILNQSEKVQQEEIIQTNAESLEAEATDGSGKETVTNPMCHTG